MLSRQNVLLVFPKFTHESFWSYRAACEIGGAKAMAPPLGLITLAAMLPSEWSLRLVDRNTAELTDADLDWADLVMTGGMQTQQSDSLAIIRRAKARGVPVAVGGPDPTSCPHIYEEADFRVVGEAEGVLDRFVAAWGAGERSGFFEAPKFQADVTQSPVPRYDLLRFQDYLFVGVQFSRGCPFTCEFCDIIELFGRVPRTKTNEQMLRELDTLVALGYRGHVDFVDDNLVGNKKALKRFLPALIEWQKARNYPFRFSTEASLNLSDDDELLGLMRSANFFAIFVGIESPDTETLISTQKKQNTRRSLAESVHKLYEAGMFVTAGFIVGFDAEPREVSGAMLDCIEATSIPVCMVGLLTALPNTQLTRRLEREGRLFPGYEHQRGGDQSSAGLNFRTTRPRRQVFLDYRAVLTEAYRPGAFFGRVRAMGRRLNRPVLRRPADASAPVAPPVFSVLPDWVTARAVPGIGEAAATGSRAPARRRGPRIPREVGLLWRVVRYAVSRHPLFMPYIVRTFVDCARRNPRALEMVVFNMVLFLHLHPFSRSVIRRLDEQVAAIEAGRWVEPTPLPAAETPAPTPPRTKPARAAVAPAPVVAHALAASA